MKDAYTQLEGTSAAQQTLIMQTIGMNIGTTSPTLASLFLPTPTSAPASCEPQGGHHIRSLTTISMAVHLNHNQYMLMVSHCGCL
jgi:hypothetical protein